MKAPPSVIENKNIHDSLSTFSQPASINLSTLVVQVITDFIGEHPDVKATFEVENNIQVKGDYENLRVLLKKIIVNSFLMNSSSLHHSIIFARSREEQETYFIMNSELGNSSGVSFGTFGYLDKKDLGLELQVMQAIVASHQGRFKAIGKKDIGSIFYFSLGN